MPRYASRSSPLLAHVGVVGLGLMGKSITACLLSSGQQVTVLDADPDRRREAKTRIHLLLKEMRGEGLLHEPPAALMPRLSVVQDYAAFSKCQAVIEAISENLRAKKSVLRELERVVSARCLIASNTSAIPISTLQAKAAHPERMIGMHWAEPAHVTRFMEIVCGRRTSPGTARRALHWARCWQKDPSLVRKDVRGFITNRLSYAMFREAFHLVETGVATYADIDRSLRNDVGAWITFAGPFRYMDLMGIPAYRHVMRDLLPDLHCSPRVPRLMRQMVDLGACGISNGRGFYRYTPAQARLWEELYLKFNYDIRRLADKYAVDAGNSPRRTPARGSHHRQKT